MKKIETYRVRPDRSEKLQAQSFDLSMKKGELVTPQELIGFLIDNCADEIVLVDGKLKIVRDFSQDK